MELFKDLEENKERFKQQFPDFYEFIIQEIKGLELGADLALADGQDMVSLEINDVVGSLMEAFDVILERF